MVGGAGWEGGLVIRREGGGGEGRCCIALHAINDSLFLSGI